MKRGRKPQPQPLKVLRGNPGKRKVRRTVPPPAGALPPCPKWLEPEARAEWKRLVPQLALLGVVGPLDWGALAAYCQCWARWRSAEIQLDRSSQVIEIRDEEKRLKQAVPSPYVSIGLRYLAQMRQYASELGLTPAAREALTMPGSKSEDDPFLKLFAGGDGAAGG